MRLFVALSAIAIFATAAAADCAMDDDARRVRSGSYSLGFASETGTLPVGRHFSLQVLACRDGAPFEGSIQVKADMPAHGHGMNYRPEVTADGDGRYRVDGMMFHMPGAWRILFTLDGAAGRKVLAYEAIAR